MKGKLFGLLLSAMTTFNASAGVKVVVLSDPHVIQWKLLEDKIWNGDLQSDRKMLDYSIRIFDAMVGKIRNEIKPDVVLVTGDLTDDGTKRNHQVVSGRLKTLVDDGIVVSVIPGNHDTNALAENVPHPEPSNPELVSYTDTKTAYGQVMREMYSAMGYGPDSKVYGNTLTYSREVCPGLVILGIDTGMGGTVSGNSLSWIEKEARDAASKGKKVIAMTHHPLIPHFNGVDILAKNAVVTNGEKVRDDLCTAGVKVVLSGHIHSSDIATELNGDLTKSIIDIGTGSLSEYPCHYRVLDFSDDMQSVSVSTGSITAIDGVEDFPSVAKERLRLETEKYVSGQENILHIMPSTVADAVIYHHEGNEDDNPEAQRTLEKILELTATARELGIWQDEQLDMADNMALSLLKDISHYGDADRENKTDDLFLDIDLSSQTAAVDNIHVYDGGIFLHDIAGRKVKVPGTGMYILRHGNSTRKIIR